MIDNPRLLCYTVITKEREVLLMQIAIIADDSKKELMAQFCIAYCGILCHHHLCATSVTGKYIAEATGLEIEALMSGEDGGSEQIISRIACDEVDIVFFFRAPEPEIYSRENGNTILRLCDMHTVPIATNIATAEVLVMALDRGDLSWRER